MNDVLSAGGINGGVADQIDRPGTAAKRRAITVVLGTQHSGISLCSKILRVIGCDIADRRLVSEGDCRSEGGEIAQAHDRILHHFRRGFDQSPDFPLPVAWWGDPVVHSIKRELVALLRDRIGDVPFGFADDKTSRLLPLWGQIFSELQLDPKFVVCLRNPAVVARALSQGEGLAAEAAEYRWLLHNMELFQFLRNAPACVIEAETWMVDPLSNLEKIHAFFDPDQIMYPDFIRNAAIDIAVAGLGDGRSPNREARQPLVRQFYYLLRRWADDASAQQRAGEMIGTVLRPPASRAASH